MRRFKPFLRRTFITLLLCVTTVIWALLVVDTVGLARQAVARPPEPTPTTTATPTSLTQTEQFAAPTVLPETTPVTELDGQNLHPKTGRYIAAWLPDSFGSINRESFEANADILDEVSPFWYSPDASGNLLHGSDARDETLLELARSKGVLMIPSIHNVLNTDPVSVILQNPEVRSRHVQNIVDEVLTYNYDGIDIDYEGLDSSLREEFSAFIVELSAALREHNKMLTIAVHAKTCDNCGLGGFQDWSVIGPEVDRLRIMTYDYHWRGGGPGPVAPVYWVRDVAEYARTVVDPAKVIIGVPFYGYNWPLGGGRALGQTWDMIDAQIQARGLTVNLMESDSQQRLVQENWITYDGREVWFSTSSGLRAKIELVQELDLAGIAIWRLGGEDPKNWEVIRNQLVEDPFESQRMLNQVLPEH
ncbi:MAG: glycoside hydrolase [Chloroflexi bacterium AL-W]|nr:glycoside hydrolase [Chloroflexi bacterium AL-N1]NOK65579.1 glycoside hydrolase [Chloroflexi bacterium AL-N10]NOK74480.1 glycoside hydrolase [Chloroflexi bacterium AL-N5]NOK80612.1 glycoside hydrolase [Chloroflexi bacterium AL-W]NOK88738.1 glycoside hydrolase [Chloroflexi bacterium AL-N15]